MATRFSKGGREFHCTRSRHAVPAHTALHQQLQTIRTSWSSQQPPAAACSGTSSNRFAHTHGIINILLHDHQGSYTRQHRHRCSPQRLQTSAVPETAAGITTTGTTSYAWSSFVSRRINLDLALEEAIAGATANRDPDWAPELAIVFLSSAYVAEYGQLVQLLRTRIPSLQHVFGSTGYGVIGSTHEGPEEIEHAPSLSLTLASLPGVHLSIKHVTQQQLPDGDAPPDRWADLVGVHLDSEASDTNFIILADPEFHKLMELTAGLDFAFPAANKIGGLVSSGKLSPARAMFAWSQTAEQQLQQQQEQQQTPVQPDDQQQQEQQSQVQHQPSQQQQQQLQQQTVVRTGAVVLSLQGSVQMELLVAQGCRPLSDNIYTIDKTASHSSVVLGLRDDADRALTPVEALQRELQKAANSKTELLQLLQNMALGIMPDTLRSSLSSSSSEGASSQPEPQDFLIRGVALDKSGFMVVGDAVRAGQKIRFMVRDREGAQQDLTSHCLAYKKRELAASMAGQPRPQVFGMLLFSCNGRGMNLYDEPSYDSRTLASYIPVPCAGFMCNGEIGTVGSSTHLHGFTCAAAVLKAAPSPHHDAAVEPAE